MARVIKGQIIFNLFNPSGKPISEETFPLFSFLRKIPKETESYSVFERAIKILARLEICRY